MRFSPAALILLVSLSAQQLPDAKSILDNSSGAIKKFRTYQYESDMNRLSRLLAEHFANG